MRAREITLYSRPAIQNFKNVAFVPLALKGIFSVHVVYVSWNSISYLTCWGWGKSRNVVMSPFWRLAIKSAAKVGPSGDWEGSEAIFREKESLVTVEGDQRVPEQVNPRTRTRRKRLVGWPTPASFLFNMKRILLPTTPKHTTKGEVNVLLHAEPTNENIIRNEIGPRIHASFSCKTVMVP